MEAGAILKLLRPLFSHKENPMLIRVEHPIVEGNDTGYIEIEHDQLKPEHKIVGIEVGNDNDTTSIAIRAMISATALFNALSEGQKALASQAVQEHFAPKPEPTLQPVRQVEPPKVQPAPPKAPTASPKADKPAAEPAKADTEKVAGWNNQD
jgi:hypothetical protein